MDKEEVRMARQLKLQVQFISKGVACKTSQNGRKKNERSRKEDDAWEERNIKKRGKGKSRCSKTGGLKRTGSVSR